MKINFNKIYFRPSLFKPAAPFPGIHQQIANAIWQSRDVAAGKLAFKLFDEPEIEISDSDISYIKAALNVLPQWVRTPVLEAIKGSGE